MDLLELQCLHYLLRFWNPKASFLLFIFFHVETNQMFIICNDFVIAKHDLHNLKYDLIQKCVLICFKN